MEFTGLDLLAGRGGSCAVSVSVRGRGCAAVLEALASLGVELLWGHVEGGDLCSGYFVLSGCPPEGFADRLGEAGVRVERLEAGLPGSAGVFPLMAGGVRAMVLREDIAAGIVRGMTRELGDVAWSVLMYHIGREYGRAAYDRHVSTLRASGAEAGGEELLRLAEAMFRALGYGVLEQSADKRRGEAYARIRDSYECRVMGALGRKGRTSQFFRGALSGWFSGFMGREMFCEETACINDGAPYCEFRCRAAGEG